MNKLDMAHDFVMNCIKNPTVTLKADDIQNIINNSWIYTDLMQAKADKRETKGFPEVLQDDWQPDWSVAPDWANWWIKTSGKCYAWLGDKPEISNIIPHWNIECIKSAIAPSFNYQGDWKQSLRKRPETKPIKEKPKQHKCNCAHWKGSSFFMGDTFTCNDCGGAVTI